MTELEVREFSGTIEQGKNDNNTEMIDWV